MLLAKEPDELFNRRSFQNRNCRQRRGERSDLIVAAVLHTLSLFAWCSLGLRLPLPVACLGSRVGRRVWPPLNQLSASSLVRVVLFRLPKGMPGTITPSRIVEGRVLKFVRSWSRVMVATTSNLTNNPQAAIPGEAAVVGSL